MTQFADLGLAEPVLRALAQDGYSTPTPIQAQAIPPLLEGRDLIGIAQTGTGKTCAFAAPLITRLLLTRERALPHQTSILVLAPTRELAAQIEASFRDYGRFARLRTAVIFGGVSLGPQTQALARGVDVLVATPGRLLDHIERGAVRFDAVKAVVLDEADHMLDLGFILPIRRIFSKLPKQRQTLLFSATMPSEIATLAAELLREPTRVAVTPVAKTADRVTQRVVFIEAKRKRDALVELLRGADFSRSIVFTRTKRGADKVAAAVEDAGISVAAIHGNKSQNQRSRALDGFRSGKTAVLVATDIAARGIDIDDVSHVINFELPEVPEAYVHRIGRTARAGNGGEAISFCDNEERSLLRAIEKLTKQSIPAQDRRLAPGEASQIPATPSKPQERPRGAQPHRANGKPAASQAKLQHRGAPGGAYASQPRNGVRPGQNAGVKQRFQGGRNRHQQRGAPAGG